MKPVPSFNNYHVTNSGSGGQSTKGVDPRIFWILTIAGIAVICAGAAYCARQNSVIEALKNENKQLLAKSPVPVKAQTENPPQS